MRLMLTRAETASGRRNLAAGAALWVLATAFSTVPV